MKLQTGLWISVGLLVPFMLPAQPSGPCVEGAKLLFQPGIRLAAKTSRTVYVPYEALSVSLEISNESGRALKVPDLTQFRIGVDVGSFISSDPAQPASWRPMVDYVYNSNDKGCEFTTVEIAPSSKISIAILPVPPSDSDDTTAARWSGVVPHALRRPGKAPFDIHLFGTDVSGHYEVAPYEWVDSVCVSERPVSALDLEMARMSRDKGRGCRWVHVLWTEGKYVALAQPSASWENSSYSMQRMLAAGKTSEILSAGAALVRIGEFAERPILSHSFTRGLSVNPADLQISVSTGSKSLIELERTARPVSKR